MALVHKRAPGKAIKGSIFETRWKYQKAVGRYLARGRFGNLFGTLRIESDEVKLMPFRKLFRGVEMGMSIGSTHPVAGLAVQEWGCVREPMRDRTMLVHGQ